ncbi:MAG: cobalt ECF transporter T component CbiQ [Nitrososphaerales archaeon]
MIKELLKAFEDLVYLERYPLLNGYLQKIDPRIKLFATAILIIVIVSTLKITPLLLLLITIISFTIVSKIPLKNFLIRVTIFIPIFAGIITLPLPFITPGLILTSFSIAGFSLNLTYEGVYKMILFTFRVWLSIAYLILLILTTKFTNMLYAMRRLKFPQIFIMLTSITYRFIFTFINESYRMILARESRITSKQRRLDIMRDLGNIIGTLFIRAYERGERVYFAMVSRGYSGEIKSINKLKIHVRDVIFLILTILICAVTILLNYLMVI